MSPAPSAPKAHSGGGPSLPPVPERGRLRGTAASPILRNHVAKHDLISSLLQKNGGFERIRPKLYGSGMIPLASRRQQTLHIGRLRFLGQC